MAADVGGPGSNVANLLSAVRRRCRIPDGSAAMSDADIIALANEEMLTVVVPAVRRIRQDYWVTSKDISIVADQAAYRLSWRAQAGTVRDIVYVDADGDEYPMPRISLEEYPTVKNGGSAYWSRTYAYATQGDKILVAPTPTTATGSIRVRYHQRPGTLVTAAEVAVITTDSGGSPYTYICSGGVPSGWQSSETELDLVQNRPGYDWLMQDELCTINSGAGTIARTAGAVTDAKEGDHFAKAGESYVIQAPDIMHPVLINATSIRVLEALGKAQGVAIAQQNLARSIEAALELLEERDEGDNPKVVARTSPLRASRRWR